ncbi:MAG: hypothetical protein JWO73_178 [Candidatus Taylorbacteria bacterium]|nr:hypothetical protein [Candidatus Taylorbacteria bacterium]
MSEGMPNQFEDADRKERIRIEEIALAKEMFESRETFPFPGILAEKYEKLKSEEVQHPGFSTPIDELIERCKSEGIKVAFGVHLETGSVYILPAQSDDIENDCLFPRQLEVSDGMNENLRMLIKLDGDREKTSS